MKMSDSGKKVMENRGFYRPSIKLSVTPKTKIELEASNKFRQNLKKIRE